MQVAYFLESGFLVFTLATESALGNLKVYLISFALNNYYLCKVSDVIFAVIFFFLIMFVNLYLEPYFFPRICKGG